MNATTFPIDTIVDMCYNINMAGNELHRSRHAVYSLKYHLVWIPKRRKKVLVDDVARRLHEIVHAVAEQRGWTVIELAIRPDHVHLLRVDHRTAPYQIAHAFKGPTSRYLRQGFKHLLRLPSLWTRSYYIATAGNVSAEAIRRYIEAQSQ